jgi:dephospho-CoA kinase
MIIGLTGSCCSGKDTVAEYISNKHGYKHYSLSDVIRKVMKKAHVEITMENLIIFGTKLRKKNGNEVLAEEILKKINPYDKCCITSIRHSDEVKKFKARKDFILINIDAPQNMRFERMQKRKRVGDPETLQKFIELEKKEFQMEGSGQQLKKTAAMADIIFVNDSNNIITLEIRIEKLLKNIKNIINTV